VGHTFPPVGFPVYGLAAWDGPRWLEFFSGAAGRPVDYVVLAHGHAIHPVDLRPFVLVKTEGPLLRPRREEQAAGDALLRYVDALRLPTTSRRAAGDPRPTVEQLVALAAAWATWPIATWTLDDRAVVARIFRWAGAWAGFTLDGPLAVTVFATAIEPDGLALRAVSDADAYTVDLAASLVWPESVIASTEAALGPGCQTDTEPHGWLARLQGGIPPLPAFP
jgi:hypothetical protein